MVLSVTLRRGKEEPVKRKHPWIFSGAIESKSHQISDGDFVTINSASKEPLGVGFYNSSSIAIKVVAFGKESTRRSIEEILKKHVEEALELREALGLVNSDSTTAFRLANAEGDQLPGLIVDVYNDTAVMQLHSPGMYRHRKTLAEILCNLKGGIIKSVVSSNESSDAGEREWLTKPGNEKIIMRENDLQFHVDLEHGQKTGFFLDQRLNRSIVGRLSNQKAVLNVCSYSGGFSIYALKGGASRVVSLDVSKDALMLAQENAVLNGVSENHQTVCNDCFEYLAQSKNEFDSIILDPPAFAKHRGAVKNAIKGYRNLNKLGFQALRAPGILTTFSCSQLVTKDEFESAVLSGAIDSGRTARVIYRLHQAPCHPTSIHHSEGPYLKGLVVEVR